MRPDILPVIQIQSLGDALLTFVNGQYIGEIHSQQNVTFLYILPLTIKKIGSGFGHGSFIEKSFAFTKPVSLKTGINHISILAMTVGLPVNS